MWGHSRKVARKVAIYRPGRESSPETKHYQNLDLGFSSLWNCEKIHFCCLSHPVYGILLWQPEQTKTLGLHHSICILVCDTAPNPTWIKWSWRQDPRLVRKDAKSGWVFRASLVVQWLRIRLPMRGTRVRAPVREDPTCRGATKPVHHNYWACSLEPACHNCWARKPQLLSPRATTTEARALRACAPQQEKPLRWEARALRQRVAPARRN